MDSIFWTEGDGQQHVLCPSKLHSLVNGRRATTNRLLRRNSSKLSIWKRNIFCPICLDYLKRDLRDASLHLSLHQLEGWFHFLEVYTRVVQNRPRRVSSSSPSGIPSLSLHRMQFSAPVARSCPTIDCLNRLAVSAIASSRMEIPPSYTSILAMDSIMFVRSVAVAPNGSGRYGRGLG